MKKSILLLIALSAARFAGAQDLTVNGSVKDSNGNTVSLALVQDKSDQTAVRTDSLGRFSLKANPNSTLIVSSSGFEPKIVSLKGKPQNDLLVVLNEKKVVSDETPAAAPPAFNGLAAYNGVGGALMYGNKAGALLPSFHPVEATQGSRYKFADWVTGFVIMPNDSVINNSHYYYNYDKTNGGLLLSTNKKEAIEVDNDKIKSFTLYDNGAAQIYESVPEIDKRLYTQVLSAGKKYKVYKLTKTKFVKNDFVSDGMTSHGNNYDEYVDEPTYYVLNVATKQLQKVQLKKKALKAAFPGDDAKLNNFLAMDSGAVNDTYLEKLGDYLNK